MMAGAPSFELFGAYFPAWMLCAGVGITGAVIARLVLVSARFAMLVSYQLPVCVAGGVTLALLVWLALFR
jgi:hypothetical protein